MNEKILRPHEEYASKIISGKFTEAKKIIDDFYKVVFNEYKKAEDIDEKKRLLKTLLKTEETSNQLIKIINSQQRNLGEIN